jgi:phosphoribosylglycinamide formyltransferase-1
MAKMADKQRLLIGFLASHGGSSMRAIVAAIAAGDLDAEARLVVSNNADCAALQFARDHGLAWRHISAASAGDPEAADAAIADAMRQAGVNLVVLSGYMRKLGPAMLDRYAGRILNIHPGLLPKFGGQGMYGRRVHEAVAAAGETASGATIHVVDGGYDTGPIIAQQRTQVDPGDTAEEIEARVRALEPGLFVQTLKRIAKGEIALP